MRKPAKMIVAASTVAVLLGSMTMLPVQIAAADEDMVKAGKKLAENRKKGNCFGCHAYEGVKMPGNVGPPLVAMKARYPDKKKLYDQIWDASKANPKTLMPPFGKHELLSNKEIKLITEWVHSL